MLKKIYKQVIENAQSDFFIAVGGKSDTIQRKRELEAFGSSQLKRMSYSLSLH
jgi:hypothetical protein